MNNVSILAACSPVHPPVSIASLAWLGGFIDGEGSIHIAKGFQPCNRYFHYQLVLYIAQNCPRTLSHAQGILNIKSAMKVRKSQPRERRPVWGLTYYGRHARDVLEHLLPYLVRKQAEAQVAMDFYKYGGFDKHPGGAGHPPEVIALREACRVKLQQLK